jgi:hypothetical protein
MRGHEALILTLAVHFAIATLKRRDVASLKRRDWHRGFRELMSLPQSKWLTMLVPPSYFMALVNCRRREHGRASMFKSFDPATCHTRFLRFESFLFIPYSR